MKYIAEYPVYERGVFRDKEIGILVEEEGQTYVRCTACLRIINFEDSFNRLVFTRKKICDGPGSCVVCRDCGNHFYFVVSTSNHKDNKVMGAVRREFGPLLEGGSLSDADCRGDRYNLVVTLKDRLGKVCINKSKYTGITFSGWGSKINFSSKMPDSTPVEEVIRVAAEKTKAMLKGEGGHH